MKFHQIAQTELFDDLLQIGEGDTHRLSRDDQPSLAVQPVQMRKPADQQVDPLVRRDPAEIDEAMLGGRRLRKTGELDRVHAVFDQGKCATIDLGERLIVRFAAGNDRPISSQ